uniref:Uncharacterized protein n=1 Tax=Anopheles christyi TaxID=43041 RepID=A0A182KJ29_9DIPT
MYLQVRQLLVQIVIPVVVARTIGSYVSYHTTTSPLLSCGGFVRELLLGCVRRLDTTVRIHVRADRTVRRGRHVPVHHGRRIVRVETVDRAALTGCDDVLAHLVVLSLQVAARARHHVRRRVTHLRHAHRHRNGGFAVLARRVWRVRAIVHLILAEIRLRVTGMVCCLAEIIPAVRVLRVMLVILIVSLTASHRTGDEAGSTNTTTTAHHFGARWKM